MKTLNELRIRMLQQAFALGFSHMPSALSALPIIYDIYQHFDKEHDVFILSKGHGSYALYAVLEELGYHPDWNHHEPQRDPANGILTTAGSLGHGLPIACGIAYSKILTKSPGKVHVLLGDGEAAEGTTWESLLFATKYYLDNLHVHIDCNGYQAISKTIYDAALRLTRAFPVVNIARHIYTKGEGIQLFADRPDVHVKPISKEEYEKAMEELCVQPSARP